MAIYPRTPPVPTTSLATMHPLAQTGPALLQVANMPAGVALAPGATGGLSVTWTPPAVDGTHGAATGFNLRYEASGSGVWTTVSGVISPYALLGLAAGTAFDVQVQSVNATGTSAWSPTATLATAPAAPNLPGAPSLVQGNGSDLIVAWTVPPTDLTHSAATVYNLRWSPSGAGAWTVVMGVSSPYDLAGLGSDAGIDVEVQASNAGGASGWSATSTLTTASTGPFAPNAPAIASAAPVPDGTASKLAIVWTAPLVDSTHGAATGYNLRYGPSGAGTWTIVSGVSSPYLLAGLPGATAIDVAVQGTGAAPAPGAWSATVTATTWGATIAQGNWTPAASQVHNTSVVPNGGANMTATPAPTVVSNAAFAWSASATVVPTSGLIEAAADGQTNGWGQWFNAPATAGTYYLWLLAQAAGGATIGALASPAITVT
ncbi:MAG TPA: fibronectin type III domain-containing protein [Acetobacteraceae bacterium]|nr:fibronectin type III domain-containing protein [Acetobacteraceae bacterium]